MNTQHNKPIVRSILMRALVVLAVVMTMTPFLAASAASVEEIPTVPVATTDVKARGLHPADQERPAAEAAAPPRELADVLEEFTASEWDTMQDLMRTAEYQFTWQTRDGSWAYRAPNRAHNLSLAFAPGGFTATRYDANGGRLWDVRLNLLAYGEQTFPVAINEAGLSGRRERVEYRWNGAVTEWYENSADGVKHGLTLYAPPEGGDVVLTFALRGDLAPELDSAGQGLRLRDAGGGVALLYDQLLVTDATGRPLPAHLEIARNSQFAIHIDATSAVYPLTVDPLLHTEIAILRASDAQQGDSFGWSVAISGDTVVVGAYYEDGGPGDPLAYAGAAYVFTRNQTGADNWGEVTILRASDAQAEDRFGVSVTISGDTVVIGAEHEDGGSADPLPDAGAAYVFARNQGGADNWGEVTILRASDTQENDRFGYSVAISSDIVVVGAWIENGGPGDPTYHAGAAYVFERNQGGADNWGEVQILHASDAQLEDYFGYSVAISGDTVVVGAFQEDGGPGDPLDRAGAAYIYARNQGGADNWGEVTILRASDAQVQDGFGWSVSISGDTVVVGAHEEDGGTGDPLSEAGAAYVFARNQDGADNWGEVQILRASDTQAYDHFGTSVSISGDTVVVGAPDEDGPGNPAWWGAGAAYVFVASGGVWQETAIARASDAQARDFFGVSVAISGDTVVVGAHEEDGGTGDPLSRAGAAYVFERNQGGVDNWGEVTILRASDAQVFDFFGVSVAISGDTVVVGAEREDGGPGNPLNDAGAAYVFARNQGGAENWGQVAKLTASDAQAEDNFGYSVAISGDTVVAGADEEDGGPGDPASIAGAAYVFERNQGGAENWGQVAKLTASDAQAGDRFGWLVSISDDMVIVGAYDEDGGPGDPASIAGAAYVFERNQGGAENWGQVAKLTASDAQAGDYFGWSVSISGDTVIVGARGEKGGPGDPASWAGAVYVFERNQGGADNWGQVQILRASDAQAYDNFGYSVAISGDTVVVGAFQEDGGPGDPLQGAGAAYIFARNQGGADNWGQVQILRASDAQAEDSFGHSVAISGDTVVVGAVGEDGGPGGPLTYAGAAYVFNPTLLSVPDLVIVKTATPSTAAPGAPITYTLTFSNTGAALATGVVITDSIPISVTHASLHVSNSGATITATGSISCAWDVEDLGPSEGGVITITGVLSTPLAAGIFTNTAIIIIITTTATDNDPSNNTSSAAVTVPNVAPVANDDSDTTPEDTPLDVAAPGVLTNDTDANGDPLTGILNLEPESGTLTFNSDGSFAYTPTLNFNGPVTFTYHASDGQTDSDTATVTITVSADNDPPVADAGADQFVDAGVVVTLDGSGSSDPDDDPLTYGWVQAGGEPVTLSDSMAMMPTFTTAVTHTVLTFTLVVTDAPGAPSEPDTVVITVSAVNDPPVADAGADQFVDAGVVVTLDGSGSSDPDDDPLTYGWVQAGGEPVTLSDSMAMMPTFTTAVTHTVLTFTLVVTDAPGAPSEPDTVVITVNKQHIYLPLILRGLAAQARLPSAGHVYVRRLDNPAQAVQRRKSSGRPSVVAP